MKNIVLSGGSTQFSGMKERLKREIQGLTPSNLTPEIEAPNER